MWVNIMYNKRLYVIIKLRNTYLNILDMKNIQYFILKDFNIEFYIGFIFTTGLIKDSAHFMKKVVSFILLIFRLFARRKLFISIT